MPAKAIEFVANEEFQRAGTSDERFNALFESTENTQEDQEARPCEACLNHGHLRTNQFSVTTKDAGKAYDHRRGSQGRSVLVRSFPGKLDDLYEAFRNWKRTTGD